MNKTIKYNQTMPIRLDHYLVQWWQHKDPDQAISRSQIIQAIKTGTILVNNQKVKPGYMLNHDDNILLQNTIASPHEHVALKPLDIPLAIVFEDEDLIVINKPNDLVVHPAIGHYDDTLLNALIFHTKQLSNINGPHRLGIVHRLDRFTTGLIIIAKNNMAHEHLSQQLQSRTLKRKYLAICHGLIQEDTGTINAPIGRNPKHRIQMCVTNLNSKEAITNFVVIKRSKEYTYIECSLKTGRTHQIRVHLNYIHKTILGDHLYGGVEDKQLAFGQYLHAYKISFIHPRSSELMQFEVPAPQEFLLKLKELHLNN